MAYVMHEERLLGEPGMDYFQLLDDGYVTWGFDTTLLDKALSDSIGGKAARQYLKTYAGESVTQDHPRTFVGSMAQNELAI